MAISDLVTSKSATSIIEGLKATLATPAPSLTPSTFTAMIGINQGSALQLAAPVQATMSQLANIAASNSSANVQAAAALSSLTSFQSGLGFSGTPNHAAFGDFLNQAQGHIKNATDLRTSTDFMANINYSDFGAGITDMGSSADRGMVNQLGSLSGAGAAMLSTGSIFNGISVKSFGTPSGLVEALNNNKLGNASGVNDLLAKNGVPLDDLNNPVYTDQINQVMGSVTNPAIINTAATQFGITDPYGGLPSYNGSDSSLNTQNAFSGAAASATVTGVTTVGSSTASTAFGATAAPVVGTGGIQSLKDLSDPSKLANPADTAGFSGVSALTTHLSDLGARSVKDASQAPDLFGQIQSVTTPLHSAAFPSLSGLISDHQSIIDNMTGTGSGPKGLPNMTDFTQHLAGGPSITSFLQTVGSNASAAISALTASIATATSLFIKAGADFTAPVKNTLGSSMNFAQNLHKFGADNSGSGIGDILHNMANTSTPYGEAIKASLAEGKNSRLLSDNGVSPLTTAPPPPVGKTSPVNFPITVSRRFDRPPGSVTGSYVTIEATATGRNNWDQVWKIINGETTTKAGNPPYAELFSGSYIKLYTATLQIKDDQTTAAPQIWEALPMMKAELDSQLSGGSPSVTG
jgi:hypothetical protein